MKRRTLLLIVMVVSIVAIVLNLLTFFSAYPSSLEYGARKARDFSAYYEAAYRFIHNPLNVYAHGSQPGDYPITPEPTTFKYVPFFLLFIFPLLSLDYHSALVLFNAIQLCLLPVIAFLVYKMLAWRSKGPIIIGIVLGIVLIEPLAAPLSAFQPYRLLEIKTFLRSGSISSLADGFSNSYYYQWVDAESKVLQIFLIFLSGYLATRRSWFGGAAFALSSFDPRFTLIALPIIFIYNFYSKNVKKFVISGLITFSVSNLPLLLYSNIAGQFIARALTSGPLIFYDYEWIPFYSILAITFANYDMFLKPLRTLISRGHHNPAASK